MRMLTLWNHRKSPARKAVLSPAFWAMLLILAIRVWFYSIQETVTLFNDSASYIDYPFSKVLHLQLQDRTPLYPLVIRICKLLFGSGYLLATTYFQIAVSFIAAAFLYKTLSLLIRNKILVCVITVLYACNPAVIGWDKSILTESLSLSGIMLFLYCIVRFLKKPSAFFAIAAPVLLLIVTFIRPSFLAFVFITAAFWLLFLIFQKEHRKVSSVALITSVITIALIGLYAWIFSWTQGFVSISCAVVRQDMYVNIANGYYKSSSDGDFVKLVDGEMAQTKNDVWATMQAVYGKYSIHQVIRLNKECRSKNFGPYTEYLRKLTINSSDVFYDGYSHFKKENAASYTINGSRVVISSLFMNIRFIHVYLIILLELFISVLTILKTRQPPWIHLGLFVFPLSIIATTFIGTCGEFMRTSICVLPFVYLAVGIFIHRLAQRYRPDTPSCGAANITGQGNGNMTQDCEF